MEKDHLTLVFGMFVFGRVIKITPPGKDRWQLPLPWESWCLSLAPYEFFATELGSGLVARHRSFHHSPSPYSFAAQSLWIGEVISPQRFPVGSHERTNHWRHCGVFSDIQYTVEPCKKIRGPLLSMEYWLFKREYTAKLPGTLFFIAHLWRFFCSLLFFEPRHCRILKGSGPINTMDCQSLTCTFHRRFAASRCRDLEISTVQLH